MLIVHSFKWNWMEGNFSSLTWEWLLALLCYRSRYLSTRCTYMRQRGFLLHAQAPAVGGEGGGGEVGQISFQLGLKPLDFCVLAPADMNAFPMSWTRVLLHPPFPTSLAAANFVFVHSQLFFSFSFALQKHWAVIQPTFAKHNGQLLGIAGLRSVIRKDWLFGQACA